MRKSAKRHFVDPSLAAAAIGADSTRLLNNLDYFGQLFESLVVRDLRIYAQPLGAQVYHYRDSAGTEVDAIIELRNGTWGAFEVKLAEARAPEAADNLLRFQSKLNPRKTSAPTTLAVITGGKHAYTLDNEVHVIPLSTLKP